MVERFNGRIEEVRQSHHFHSGEELETTLHRYVLLYNWQFSQSALGSKTPLQAMKDWHKLKLELIQETAILPYGMGLRRRFRQFAPFVPSHNRALCGHCNWRQDRRDCWCHRRTCPQVRAEWQR